jgi:hypothetical protein
MSLATRAHPGARPASRRPTSGQSPRSIPGPARRRDHAQHQTGGCSTADQAAGSQSQAHRHRGYRFNNRWVCRRLTGIRSAAAKVVSRPASSRARTSIRFSSRLLISTTPIGSAASKPHDQEGETDIPTLLSADILALRLHDKIADPTLWNFRCRVCAIEAGTN